MSSCPALDCANVLQVPPPLQPNPDISGIGVLVGFFASAYLAWILLVIHYVWVFDPTEASLAQEKRPTNPIDKMLVEFITRITKRPEKTKNIWSSALEKMILMMSDQQMITGIALMVSAITQLRCGISAYHWQITIYLVWFSSFTHLATLTFPRGYLHENSPLRWWRLFFMTALIGLLTAALVPTRRGDWLPDDQPALSGTPALCMFDYSQSPPESASWITMLFSILVLSISYTTRAIKLFKWSSEASRSFFRTTPGNALKKHLGILYTGSQKTKANKWILSTPYYVILAVFLVIRSWMDFLETMFWEITWLLIALLWGTLRLLSTRNSTIDQNNDILQENSWGFGQCLSTAMVLLLLFSGIETCLETKRLIAQSLLTTPQNVDNSSTGNVDDAEHRAVLPPSNGDSNTSAFPETSPIERASAETADITDHGIVAAGTDDQLQRNTRSATVLSWEERSMETSSHRHNPVQTVDSLFELERSPNTASTHPETRIEPQQLAPHMRDYYDDKWYRGLVYHNSLIIIVLSGGILSGASGKTAGFDGLFGNARDVGAMVLHLFNWVLVYAPLSSCFITLPYVLFRDTHRIRLKRIHTFASRVYWYQTTALAFAFCLLFAAPSASRETLVPRDMSAFNAFWLYIWIYFGYSCWYVVICEKLKREART